MASTPWRTRGVDLLADLVGRSITRMDAQDIRRARAAVAPARAPITWITGPPAPEVTVSASTAPTRQGRRVGLRVYTPAAHRPGRDAAGLRPLVLWFHGGGWVLGNVVNYDPLCGFLAHQVGAVVLSVDYRLAPEHPAPAAIHDCLDVTRWAWQHAPQVGADPARMAVAGDSAGGNLATVVAQLLRDDGGPQLRCQALVYPVVDSTCLRRSKIVHSTGPILTRRETDTFLAMYLGTGPDALTTRDPLISPLLGRLEGLPPTLIQTAGLDPLHDEGLAYAEALRAAGVEVRATDYPLAPHGFASFPGASKGAWPHRSELAGHLRARLAG